MMGFQKFRNWLSMPEDRFSVKTLLLLILIAFLFSVGMRFILANKILSQPINMYKGEPLLTTIDAFTQAAMLEQDFMGKNESNIQLKNNKRSLITAVAYLVYKMTPFSLESVLFFLPIYFFSLIVIPIILIGRIFGSSLWGFFCALLTSIAHSVFNRTHAGYFDTDMAALLLPMLALLFLFMALKQEKLHGAYLASIILCLYPLFYDFRIAQAIAGFAFLFCIALFIIKKKLFFLLLMPFIVYPAIDSGLFSYKAAGIELYWIFKILVLSVLFLAIFFLHRKFQYQFKFSTRFLLFISVAILLLGFLMIMMVDNPIRSIIFKMQTYAADEGKTIDNLHFLNAYTTIREAKQINLEYLFVRMCGSVPVAVIALIGFIFLCIKRSYFILMFPVLFIGLFSVFGGLRFTIYASLVLPFGFFYLLYVLIKQFSGLFLKNRLKGKHLVIAEYTLLFLFCLFALIPNIYHIVTFNKNSSTYRDNVAALKTLKEKSKPGDYVISWWDFGSSIWYHAERNAIISPIRNAGPDNYIISKILVNTNSRLSANLSRQLIEYYKIIQTRTGPKSIWKYPYATLALLKSKEKNTESPQEIIQYYGKDDPELLEPSCDIYLYLNYKMIAILPVIANFSRKDLITDRSYSGFQLQMAKANQFRFQNSRLFLANGLVIDFASKVIDSRRVNAKNQIAAAGIISFDQNKKLPQLEYYFQSNPHGALFIFYHKHLNQVYIMDVEVYRSLFIQMFLFGNYDKELFELIDSNLLAQVYRIKK